MKNPLPQEITSLPDSATACTYCGISYLLLHKYESMQSHVQSLESRLARLVEYEQERPGLLSRVEILQAQVRLGLVQAAKIEALEGEVRAGRERELVGERERDEVSRERERERRVDGDRSKRMDMEKGAWRGMVQVVKKSVRSMKGEVNATRIAHVKEYISLSLSLNVL